MATPRTARNFKTPHLRNTDKYACLYHDYYLTTFVHDTAEQAIAAGHRVLDAGWTVPQSEDDYGTGNDGGHYSDEV